MEHMSHHIIGPILTAIVMTITIARETLILTPDSKATSETNTVILLNITNNKFSRTAAITTIRIADDEMNQLQTLRALGGQPPYPRAGGIQPLGLPPLGY